MRESTTTRDETDQSARNPASPSSARSLSFTTTQSLATSHRALRVCQTTDGDEIFYSSSICNVCTNWFGSGGIHPKRRSFDGWTGIPQGSTTGVDIWNDCDGFSPLLKSMDIGNRKSNATGIYFPLFAQNQGLLFDRIFVLGFRGHWLLSQPSTSACHNHRER